MHPVLTGHLLCHALMGEPQTDQEFMAPAMIMTREPQGHNQDEVGGTNKYALYLFPLEAQVRHHADSRNCT